MSTDEFDLTISDSFRTPGRRKNNFAATASPTANDDSGDGYEVGSRWIDVTADEAWTCVDSSSGAAVWVQGGGGSNDLPLFTDSVSGSHTVDHDDGVVHFLTLAGNTTLTPDATTVSGDALEMAVGVQQALSGGPYTLSWSGTIDWDTHDGNPPDMPTTAGDVLWLHFRSVDDGASWFGFGGGGGGEAATTVEDETTFGISPAVGTDTEYARQDHTHGTPADPVTESVIRDIGHWEVIMVPGIAAPPEPVLTPLEDDWIYGWVPG